MHRHLYRYGHDQSNSLPGLRCLFFAYALVIIFACAVSLPATVPSVAQNAKSDEMDTSLKPGEDFYRYANGGWLKTAAIPAGQSRLR